MTAKEVIDWLQGFFAGMAAKPQGIKTGVTYTMPLGSGYSVPQPPDVPESRELRYLHPELCRRYLALKEDFIAQTGMELFETCTYRSPTRQAELYLVGRRNIPGEKILTYKDGTTARSRHNVFPAQAVDIAVDTDPGPGKHVSWKGGHYATLGPLAVKHGLIWGGSWAFRDLPHLELRAEDA